MEKSLVDEESRNAVRAISYSILAKIAPDEGATLAGLIDPLLDMAAEGEVVKVDRSDKAGGLGSADLLAFVIVPAVVTIVSNLMLKWDIHSWKEFRQKVKYEEFTVQVEDIIVIIKRTNSAKGAKQQKEIAVAIETALTPPTVYNITNFNAPVEGNILSGKGNIIT